MALVDGADDVTPTLDLGITGPGRPSLDDASIRLDGTELPLTRSGSGIAARVSPMPLSSAHRLDILIPGRTPQRVDFHVVRPTAVMAAVHRVMGGPAVDIVFERPPDRGSVERALAGARVSWHDEQRLSAGWAGRPPGAIDLPGSITTSHGSHLAEAVHLDLTASLLRRVNVPAAPPARRLPVTGYSVSTETSRASVAAHVRQLDVLAPTGWRVSRDGSLSGAPDPPAVGAAQAARVAIWPVVQNDSADQEGISALLNDGSAARRLVSEITAGVIAGGFAGIHLDIEGVPARDRDSLSRLVHDLAVSLHSRDRRLAVDVIPHKADHLNRYSAAYDERAIGRDADVVALLAYDQHTGGSSPGPVGGLDWQGEVVAGTLEGLDPAHALLGVPLYARSWDGGSSAAAGYEEAVGRALAHEGASVDYDFVEAVPLIRWQGDDGPSFTYFDDAASIARK
ncbi:MAG: glycosyl hydrolase family 18 protein, partial [Candidatus Dormibacteria bacterium]